jgi:hypothetical protein
VASSSEDFTSPPLSQRETGTQDDPGEAQDEDVLAAADSRFGRAYPYGRPT